MASAPPFVSRLMLILKPTITQTVLAVLASILILGLPVAQPVLTRMGITAFAFNAFQQSFHLNLTGFLKSPILAQAALLTFWAIVGLVAYLVCWGVFNMLIEARNEVTLAAAYTNRGHWDSPLGGLLLKGASAAGLVVVIFTLRPSGALLGSIAASAAHPAADPLTILFGLVAVPIFAAHLYLVLSFVQLTFTPWYREEPFTQAI